MEAMIRVWKWTVSHVMAAVGSFGMLVLLANIIWGYNIYKTGQGYS
jgi:cytochrome c oxidase cbb3-type subunit 1